MARIVESRPIAPAPRKPPSRKSSLLKSVVGSIPVAGALMGVGESYGAAKRGEQDYGAALTQAASQMGKEWASKRNQQKQKAALSKMSDTEFKKFIADLSPDVQKILIAERTASKGGALGQALQQRYQPQQPTYQPSALMPSTYQLGDYGGGYQGYTAPATTTAAPALSYYSSPDYQFPTSY